ncbi:hypothetical protein [Paenibacillus sp. QZ-Y1]|uniref:hypothetical protein n=1 Tax=Paenibacillus sp. QZ-Y1 TaxID=3414511 RepID=UPI003F78B44C
MLYWWFDDVNPLYAVFVLCPIIAVVLGACSYYREWLKVRVALGVSFMLPMLFIASDWSTLRENTDAWMIYGIGYGMVTWVVNRLLHSIVGYKNRL